MDAKPKLSVALVVSVGFLIVFGVIALLNVQLMIAGFYVPERDDFLPPGSNLAKAVCYFGESIIIVCAAVYYAWCSWSQRQLRAAVFHTVAAAVLAIWIGMIIWLRTLNAQ